MACKALEKLKEETKQEVIRDLVLEWTKEGYSVQEIAKLLKRSEDFVRKVQKEASAAV